MYSRHRCNFKKLRRSAGPADLQQKLYMSGVPTGFALETNGTGDEDTSHRGVRSVDACGTSTDETSSASKNRVFRTPLNPRNRDTAVNLSSASATLSSRRSRFSRTRVRPFLNSNDSVHVVCAISENLARETCVSSLDAGAPTTLNVTKQGNGQTYAETLALLEMMRPDEILLNEGRRNSQLARKVMELYHVKPGGMEQVPKGSNKENYDADDDGDNAVWKDGQSREGRFGSMASSTVVKFISRSCFDQTKGAELLRRISREETYDATIVEEYILLSSAHAVLHYTQQTLGATLARKSVHMNINVAGNNRLSIDRSTLLQLELLVNAKTGKIRHSLIGTINCTKTVVGSRLLRTNLISPPIRADTINARLDLVDLFLGNEEFFYAVLDHLRNLPEVDRMLSNIALLPQKKSNLERDANVNERIASKGISALVCIKTTLQALPSLASVLQSQLESLRRKDLSRNNTDNENDTIVTDCASLMVGLGSGQTVSLYRYHLLRAIIVAMTQPELKEVLKAVIDVFTETTTYSRNVNAMRHQECFALKCEEHGMMSIIRKAFLANVDDIYKKADEYAELYGFQVSVRHSSARGYYLALQADAVLNLPQVFLQPTRSGRFLNCTTEEITSLNSRAQDNVHDLLLMTHDRIQEVLDIARSRYDAIAALCDSVALLDMCHSFADIVTLNANHWCRPVLSDTATQVPDRSSRSTVCASVSEPTNAMMIRNGRYAIDVADSGLDSLDVVPNDVFSAEGKNFTVITGINGSGKTIYLKQIAIITILAHCGSYVPAEAAFIPIRDRLCCRIGNADDQENNISTFMLEMKETAFICNNATEKSLILMDELGRATSNEDGVAIAWSVSEYLLKKRSMTFFVTHYPQLSSLAQIYPTVQNVHLEADIKTDNESEISYKYKVKAGPCSMPTDYGVEMAAACGWPIEVVNEARVIEKEIESLLPDNGICHPELLDKSKSRTQAYEILRGTYRSLQGFVNAERSQSYDLIRSELSTMQSHILNNSSDEILHAIDQILDRNPGSRPAEQRTLQMHQVQANNQSTTNRSSIEHSYETIRHNSLLDSRNGNPGVSGDNGGTDVNHSDGASTVSSSTLSSDETSSSSDSDDK